LEEIHVKGTSELFELREEGSSV